MKNISSKLVFLLSLLAAWVPASAFADCGDGLLEMNEECDDANDVSGDGCSEFCFIESRNVCEPAGFQLDVKEDWGGALNWVLTMDNRGITQAANSDPGVYSTTMEADIAIVEFEMAVETTDDDDFIGWTVGFDSGESTSATADWLLFDWKQANQTAFSANATRGLAMSRVEGIANTTTLWGHTGAVTEIARANNYADTGWADNQVYRVRMEASATRIRVWVDLDPNDNIPGTLEFDETGTFPTGKFGFYTFSQPNDRFTLISPPGDSYCSTDQDDDDIKDRVDEDADNDGIPDSVESPGYPYGPGNDEDTDGVPDWNDPDHVVGGCVGDGGDPARCLTLPIALDFDADGVPNHLDLDSDGDGLTDAFESGGTDDDGDGIADDCLPVTVSGACQNPVPVPPNTDETDGPDYLDTDSDGDGLGDLLEAFDVDDNEMADDVTPVGNDADADGIDDVFDPDCIAAGNPAGCMGGGKTYDPTNDLDSDGDGDPDQYQTCGDGNRTSTEACDDGNATDSDGCTACAVDSGFVCTMASPSVCIGSDEDADGDGISDIDECPPPGNPVTGVDCRDSDGDGVPDLEDPDDDNDGVSTKDEYIAGDRPNDGDPANDHDWDDDGVPNHLDLDSDNDGIPDLWENGGAAADTDKDGLVDAPKDADNDGVIDIFDEDDDDDSNTTIKAAVNTDGKGGPDFIDLDSDGDGVSDIAEANGTDSNGDGQVDSAADGDDDGLADVVDPDAAMGKAWSIPDTDKDGAPDFQDKDSDGDGIDDLTEAHDGDGDGEADTKANGKDVDGDGIDDAFDKTEDGTLPVLPDSDDDGDVDFRDVDDDGDGILTKFEKDAGDSDGDGVPDYLDTDDDGDGLLTKFEGSDPDGDGDPSDAKDTDGDGIPDFQDTDDDGDGLLTKFEGSDPDGDGDPSDARDTDGDGTPDFQDTDDDGDGIPTKDEGFDPDGDGDPSDAIDTDGDGIPDYLEGDSAQLFGISGGAACAAHPGTGVSSGALGLLGLVLGALIWRRRRTVPKG